MYLGKNKHAPNEVKKRKIQLFQIDGIGPYIDINPNTVKYSGYA